MQKIGVRQPLAAASGSYWSARVRSKGTGYGIRGTPDIHRNLAVPLLCGRPAALSSLCSIEQLASGPAQFSADFLTAFSAEYLRMA